jgi:hypothetical protein
MPRWALSGGGSWWPWVVVVDCVVAQDRAPAVRWGLKGLRKDRAVAEKWRTGRLDSGDAEPALWGEGNTGGIGHNKVCAGGAVGKFSALPREVSYGPARRSWVAGRISREVKSQAMPCEKSE